MRGLCLHPLSDFSQLLSAEVTVNRSRIQFPIQMSRKVIEEMVPSLGGHARASDKPGAISTVGFLSHGAGQALSPVRFPACLRLTPFGMCQRRDGIRGCASYIICGLSTK